jgi:branched-chain amino acid transport system ATP-binding protein
MAGGERITVTKSVRYRGKEVMHPFRPVAERRLGIVLCPERRRIFKESTVLENLKIGGYLATPSQAKETLAYMFRGIPALYKLKNRIGGFLSGGEQQMLAIGRALMAQPKILLLDEPLLGLSPLMQAMLMRTTREIRDRRNISIIVTEQYARPVFPIVDYAFILENGIRCAGRHARRTDGQPGRACGLLWRIDADGLTPSASDCLMKPHLG